MLCWLWQRKQLAFTVFGLQALDVCCFSCQNLHKRQICLRVAALPTLGIRRNGWKTGVTGTNGSGTLSRMPSSKTVSFWCFGYLEACQPAGRDEFRVFSLCRVLLGRREPSEGPAPGGQHGWGEPWADPHSSQSTSGFLVSLNEANAWTPLHFHLLRERGSWKWLEEGKILRWKQLLGLLKGGRERDLAFCLLAAP